jgi:hypothetical protein
MLAMRGAGQVVRAWYFFGSIGPFPALGGAAHPDDRRGLRLFGEREVIHAVAIDTGDKGGGLLPAAIGLGPIPLPAGKLFPGRHRHFGRAGGGNRQSPEEHDGSFHQEIADWEKRKRSKGYPETNFPL